MRRRREWGLGQVVSTRTPGRRLVSALLLALLLSTPALGAFAAQDLPPDFTPATGHAQVIAQGVVELPEEELVWRTVYYRAEPVADAPFVERPLGFVLATRQPLLLADQATGEQTRLGPGEGALVRAGTVQQRASPTDASATYLALELIPAAAEDPTDNATVLQRGQPFVPAPGRYDLDLIRDVLTGEDTLTLPDTGQANALFVTEGALGVGRPDGDPQPLLGGEAGVFSGELELSVAVADGAEASEEDRAAFVVAVIGLVVPPPTLPSPTPEPASLTPTTDETTPTTDETTADATGETGSISVRVVNCPPGMQPDTLIATACTPATGDFDFTLSSDALGTTLTLADAVEEDGAFAWQDLPVGQYRLAEAVLPVGYDAYVLVAPDAVEGTPEAGYTVTIDPGNPNIAITAYNFPPAPTGSLTVQVFNCPRGMRPENLVPEACERAEDGFDFVLSGESLDAPLTVAEAVQENPFSWQGLPYGQYTLVEATLPEGFDTYLVRGPATLGGDPESGYTITVDAAAPDALLNVYNFRPEA